MNALIKLYTWTKDGALTYVEDLCETKLENIPIPRDEITLQIKGQPAKYVCCGRHWRTAPPQTVEIKVFNPADTATFRTYQ